MLENLDKSIVAILDINHPRYDEIIKYVANITNEIEQGTFSIKASSDGAFPESHRVCFLPCDQDTFNALMRGCEKEFSLSHEFLFYDGAYTSLKQEMNKLNIKILNDKDIIRKLKNGN